MSAELLFKIFDEMEIDIDSLNNLSISTLKEFIDSIGETEFIKLVNKISNDNEEILNLYDTILNSCENTGFYDARSCFRSNDGGRCKKSHSGSQALYEIADYYAPEEVTEYPKIAWEVSSLLEKQEDWWTPDTGYNCYVSEELYEDLFGEDEY